MKVNKKWLALLSLAFLVVIGLAGCGKKSDDSLQQIKDKGVLTMGTSADYAPFEFTIMKNGKKEYVGYDIMVAQKIADSLGVKLKVQNMEFSSIISELQDHKVDIALAGMNVTPQRKKVVDFSKPYYTEQESLLVKKADADKYNTIADTKGTSAVPPSERRTTSRSCASCWTPVTSPITSPSVLRTSSPTSWWS